MWVCYFTTNWFVILRDVCELYTWNVVNRMFCVALREHFQTASPIRASLCSLGLSVRISKLSKIVNAGLHAHGFTRREIFRAVENLRWQLVKSCAGGLHLFSLVKYEIVARIGSILLYEEVCILLEAFFVALRRWKKWEISLTFVYTSFTLYALSCRYFHLQCLKSWTLLISTICWYWCFSQISISFLF